MNPHTTQFQKDLQPAVWKQELPASAVMDPEDEIASLRKNMADRLEDLESQLTEERNLSDRLAKSMETYDEVARSAAYREWQQTRKKKSL